MSLCESVWVHTRQNESVWVKMTRYEWERVGMSLHEAEGLCVIRSNSVSLSNFLWVRISGMNWNESESVNTSQYELERVGINWKESEWVVMNWNESVWVGVSFMSSVVQTFDWYLFCIWWLCVFVCVGWCVRRWSALKPWSGSALSSGLWPSNSSGR